MKAKPPTRFSWGGASLGYETMEKALLALRTASLEWRDELGINECQVSFHPLHDMKSRVAGASRLNWPGAISFADYRRGVKKGIFPKMTCSTAPGFGWGFKRGKNIIGTHHGVTINPNPDIREFFVALKLESLRQTRRMLAEGLGSGFEIIWDSEDEPNPYELAKDQTLVWSNDEIIHSQDFALRVAFWQDLIDEALKLGEVKETIGALEAIFAHEKKGGDPKQNRLPTGNLAREFRTQVNDRYGAAHITSNNEVAHDLAVGELFADELEANIAAGQFHGLSHLNSGHLFPVRFDSLLENGVHPSALCVLYDWDWEFGTGEPKVVADQEAAVARMKKWSAETGKPVFAEFDLIAGCKEPLAVIYDSIVRFHQMWEKATV